MRPSNLEQTLRRIAQRSATAVVARARMAQPALNSALSRRLAAAPGMQDSVLTEPIFEAGKIWKPAGKTFGDLSDTLLEPALVNALDQAKTERMPRDREPYAHQLAAWEATLTGKSCLVSSGTGSGKTECFMVPMLNDLLRDSAPGRLSGVRAIVVYPLNALIESQRDRLAAWTESLKTRITFGLFNGLTPERPRDVARTLAGAERGDRRTMRDTPPSILITNVTMLEYLLLRGKDRDLLAASRGLLRWIVLDEAHTYIGAQATEIALLMRRVRSAFGVNAKDVRLVATSATISEGERTREKLTQFVADLADQSPSQIRIIEGETKQVTLPQEVRDGSIDLSDLREADGQHLWDRLASHPRVGKLHKAMQQNGLTLSKVAELVAGDPRQLEHAQAVLDAVAQAESPESQSRQILLPWRAHIFHRAIGGIWVCVDHACPHRDPELKSVDAQWPYGAVWLVQRDRCECGARVFELVACGECGTVHLVAGRRMGASVDLVPLRDAEADDFTVDLEPEPKIDVEVTEDEAPMSFLHDTVWLRAGALEGTRSIDPVSGRVFDGQPDNGLRTVEMEIFETAENRQCCEASHRVALRSQRFGPPFFLGAVGPDLLETLATPDGSEGLPMGGRRAISFSDSRQGVARLAAKLQQDAERLLTRAFLYHTVQQSRGPSGAERVKKEEKLAAYRSNPQLFSDEIARLEQELSSQSRFVPWPDLVRAFGNNPQLEHFAVDVWRARRWGGREMADDPSLLAEMFLFRELFRRPRIQNSAETMGLVRLRSLDLEARTTAAIPEPLRDAGVSVEGWQGLIYAAIDLAFRDVLAVQIERREWLGWVSPRSAGLACVARPGLPRESWPMHCRGWPSAKPAQGRTHRLVRLVLRLIKGNQNSGPDQAKTDNVLTEIWRILSSTVAIDVGSGGWRLDYSKLGVAGIERGWHCPVTRRVFGYSPNGISPYGIDDPRTLSAIDMPRLLAANPNGLDPEARALALSWLNQDSQVAHLRANGLWSDLHDRIAEYAPFLRAQEHSAQIERGVLERYERLFKEGKINLLNSSTTMEMGIDIANVALVVNANVPPSVSNYRQRAGRAGRRREPWAFTTTFCRNLPLDRAVFEDPSRLLEAVIAAPAVRLDSTSVVRRHVHAALLSAYVQRNEGLSIKENCAAFFGATEHLDEVAANNAADAFIEMLRDAAFIDAQTPNLSALTNGSVLGNASTGALCAETSKTFEDLLRRWRVEHGQLLARATAAPEEEVQQAFTLRAKRMRGEFLLSELVRRGFTPAHGFPVDVVSFDHVKAHFKAESEKAPSFSARGASRTLDVAIREYAPGAEVVIDGLVHQSEGVQPAWGAMADASRLEDLQFLWKCNTCRGFGIARFPPEMCPQCSHPCPEFERTLRATGFLGRRAPHSGYESLGVMPFELPRISAAVSAWQSLPSPAAGRIRASDEGEVVVTSHGRQGAGFALCLCCGRAVEERANDDAPFPEALDSHRPLAPVDEAQLVRGLCPGGITQKVRVQRNVTLISQARTDVFEWQLPRNTSKGQALALAAALRESLAERLGTEARELGVGTNESAGVAGEAGRSLFVFDRAAGGGGLASRLSEPDWFEACLHNAMQRLDCAEKCESGCPACILRPDLNFGETLLDRPGAFAVAQATRDKMRLPSELCCFGIETKSLGIPLRNWVTRMDRQQTLERLRVYLHGAPTTWALSESGLLQLLHDVKAPKQIVMATSVLTDRGFGMAEKLSLYRMAGDAEIVLQERLPIAGGLPVLVDIVLASASVSVASGAVEDAIPAETWGHGQAAPLMVGVREESEPNREALSIERLMKLSAGNAKTLRLPRNIRHPIEQAGQKFWEALAHADSLTLASMEQHGVAELSYSDRYLVSPLNLRLLHEVLRCMPGRRNATAVSVTTASTGENRPGSNFNHGFLSNQDRLIVLQALLPKSNVQVLSKQDVTHQRRLNLTLADGRSLQISLDQGFGAWRFEGAAPRHDFGAEANAQARAILEASFDVSLYEAMHVAIEFD